LPVARQNARVALESSSLGPSLRGIFCRTKPVVHVSSGFIAVDSDSGAGTSILLWMRTSRMRDARNRKRAECGLR